MGIKNEKDFAVLGEPIVGREVVVLDERGQGARTPRMLTSTKEPTLVVSAIQNLTHMPYEDWCQCCAACRHPYNPQRLRHIDEHQLPLLLGDYASVSAWTGLALNPSNTANLC